MRLFLISFLFLLFWLCGKSQSTDLIFKHINRSSGLPVDGVTSLAQDSTGYIWIGSKEGLFRFDGFNYKSFYYVPGSKQTIPNNYISKIHIDKNNLVWVATAGGVAVLKNTGEIIQNFNSETNSLFSKESDRIFDIQELNDVLWIATGEGLFEVRKKTEKSFSLQKHDFKKKFGATNVLGSFVADDHNQFWICTINGLVIYDPVKNILFHTGNNPSQLKILHETYPVRAIYIDQQKLVQYTTWEPAVKTFDPHSNTIITHYTGKGSANPDYSKLIGQYLKDSHGTLWAASSIGMLMQRAGENKRHIIRHSKEDIYSLPSNDITSLLMDKEGSLWVGTAAGIGITNPYNLSLVNLSLSHADQFPFAKFSVNTIIPVDSNTLLIGTSGGDGLYKTDLAFNVQEHYSFGSMDYDWIWNYFKYGDSIFISTQKGNLIYHIKSKKLKKLLSPPFNTFFPVFSMAHGQNGTIWMSRYKNDFIQYDPKQNKYNRYSLGQLGELPSVLKIAIDRDNKIWLMSSIGGVFQFNESSNKISDRLPLTGKNSLVNSHILFMLDVGEDLLIGYVAHGISLYNKAKKTFLHFSRADGLASNSVTSAIQTDDKTVWISSRNGISRFDLKTKTFLNYNYDNGILQNDFNCISLLPDGRIAAGNKLGLVYFHPDQIQISPALTPPVITSINVHGNSMDVEAFSSDQPLEIKYNQNYFSFEYISLQYNNNLQIEYAYKLEGFDNDWILAGKRRFATYSNLNGGNYFFRVKARMPGSEWVESSFTLPIHVATVFYKRWWFIPLCALLLLAVGYIVFRYRMHQLLTVARMRQSISSDLHDEVGASLSSISIFSEMAKQSLHSEVKAGQYLQRIGDRSRESIEKMGDIVWSINPENDNLQQMLVRMKNYVNEVFESGNTTVHWEQSKNLSSLKLTMEERKNLYLLFKESITNAAKYAVAKNIFVQLSVQNRKVFLQITDDGNGFNPDTVKQGNGIKNMKHRARLLNGNLMIDSFPGKGTTVQLEFVHI